MTKQNYNYSLNRGEEQESWLKIKIKRRASYYQPIISKINKNDIVLDYGSGDQKLKDFIKNKNADYFSLDTDSSVNSDFKTLEEIPKSLLFDKIIFCEVIEHINYNEFINILEKLKKHMNKGTELLITTPNIYYLKIFEITHLQFYKPKNIKMLLDNLGFETKIYRLWIKSKNPLVELIRIIRFPFTYFFEIDFNCQKFLIYAKRRDETKSNS
nr:hypothetical protein [Nanoarchaeum sp.]